MSIPILLDPPPPRCWVEVDLDALVQNASLCQKLAGPACGVMAIVKADAYGHGIGRVVGALANQVAWFGVANVREALVARMQAPDAGILILSPVTPQEMAAVVAYGFAASVSTPLEVSAYAAVALSQGRIASLHAVADTGMGRMGALPEDFLHLVRLIKATGGVELGGVETHFPSADEDENFTKKQIDCFADLVGQLTLPPGCQCHLGNSAGLLGFHSRTPFASLVRPGLALYGISPISRGRELLQPVLSWKSRVALIRDLPAGATISYGRTYTTPRPMRVATLGVGYGDGYPRQLSGNGAEVLIGGLRCPLLGRVTMDQIVVDVSRLSTVQTGDEVVLLGSQKYETITADELAEKAGTIPWEILTGITSRVERIYL
jgi:alanine racemase